MRNLISVVLVLFGLSAMIAGGAELYSPEDGTLDWAARLSHIVGGVVGAGLALSGFALGRDLPWARPLALCNLVAMAALTALNALHLRGHVHATHQATRTLLALFLLLALSRLKRPAGPAGEDDLKTRSGPEART